MSKENAKRIGFFEHQRSGCYLYRVKHPMDALQRVGYEVELLRLDQDIDIDKFQSVQFYGAYPFSFEKILKFLKENGIKIVYDVDDALDLVEVSNPFYHTVMKDLASVNEILEYADEVTVSTPKLKEYIENQKNYKGKITVVPNCYVPSEWTFKRPERDGIRIGFAGASPHVPDLIEVIPVIKKLQDKYNVKFILFGFGATDYPTWYKQYRYIAQPEATKDLRKLDSLLADIVFEWVPFVDYEIYPQVLTNLSLDIGLCPLQDTPFNQHRSASKAMEYTLSGALALASDVEAYKNDNNSFKVIDWESQLKNSVEDILNKAPIKVKDEYLKWTKENRNIDTKIDLLKSVYVV